LTVGVVCIKRLVKSTRSKSRRRESHNEDDDDDDDDVADVLVKFWEQRLKIWRAGVNSSAQSHAADKVSQPADIFCAFKWRLTKIRLRFHRYSTPIQLQFDQ